MNRALALALSLILMIMLVSYRLCLMRPLTWVYRFTCLTAP